MTQIVFRDSKDLRPDFIHKGVYTLDAYRDGWFRSEEGPSRGYGLSLVSIRFAKVAGKREPRAIHLPMYDRLAYKVEIDYTPSSGPFDFCETSLAWVVVDRDEDIMDVFRYIRSNAHRWIP